MTVLKTYQNEKHVFYTFIHENENFAKSYNIVPIGSKEPTGSYNNESYILSIKGYKPIDFNKYFI